MPQFVGLAKTPNSTLIALEANGDLYELRWTSEGWKPNYIGNLIAGKKPGSFPKVIKADSEN